MDDKVHEEPKVVTVKVTKEEAKVLAFIQEAVGDDTDRELLQNIQFEPEVTNSADGWRWHAAPNFPNQPKLKGLLNPQQKAPSQGGYMVFEDNTGLDYPDVDQLVPRTPPAGEALLNVGFLSDAIKHMDKNSSVLIRFRKATDAVEILGQVAETPVYVLVMPMHQDPEKELNRWKPYQRGK